ncbi:acyl carrier protein [Natronosporangium hydrolyticum]|uniref:Acyl carrier protein n=1 Tax=Natronosporangium hydrolyticum TaxID=2811111 RepID=A0A895YPX2_9ACTN|nr:phosphopantetheine-binding protein [Natronosporangium hydrolyticum]QSB16786.1 acyl carrier protein [Natronosporangium hydrolyticum]
MNEIDVIKAFIIDEFLPDVSPDEFGPDDDLLADGVIDSLGLLKLIAWLEDRFAVAIDDAALDPNNFRSVSAMASFIVQSRLQTSRS